MSAEIADGDILYHSWRKTAGVQIGGDGMNLGKIYRLLMKNAVFAVYLKPERGLCFMGEVISI